MEEGAHSEWLYELLEPHVERIVVVQAKDSPGNKSDAKDAWDLCEKLRIDALGRTVCKAPKTFTALRQAVRGHLAQMPGHPLHQNYVRMTEAGTKPNLARLTLARRIAATVLAMLFRDTATDFNSPSATSKAAARRMCVKNGPGSVLTAALSPVKGTAITVKVTSTRVKGTSTREQAPLSASKGALSSEQAPFSAVDGASTRDKGASTSEKGALPSSEVSRSSRKVSVIDERVALIDEEAPFSDEGDTFSSVEGALSAVQATLIDDNGAPSDEEDTSLEDKGALSDDKAPFTPSEVGPMTTTARASPVRLRRSAAKEAGAPIARRSPMNIGPPSPTEGKPVT